MYRKILQNGDEFLILRQVDDIAVAARTSELASQTIKDIGSYMTVPIKDEGLIKLFNGVNVTQTKDYVKVHVSSYLERVFERHQSWMKNYPECNEPLPMKPDKELARALEHEEAPLDKDGEVDQKAIMALETEFGFKYRSATGELIFAMVTARPDISYATVKLCQYNTKPTRVHF